MEQSSNPFIIGDQPVPVATTATAAQPPLTKALLRIVREFGVLSNTSMANDSLENITQKVKGLTKTAIKTAHSYLQDDVCELADQISAIRNDLEEKELCSSINGALPEIATSAISISETDSNFEIDSNLEISEKVSSNLEEISQKNDRDLVRRFDALLDVAGSLNQIANSLTEPEVRPARFQAIQESLKFILGQKQRQALNDGLILLKDCIGSSVVHILQKEPKMLYDMITICNNIRTKILTPTFNLLGDEKTVKLLTEGETQGMEMQSIVAQVVDDSLSESEKADFVRTHRNEIESHIAHAANELFIFISAGLAFYDQQSADFLPNETRLTQLQANTLLGFSVARGVLDMIQDPEMSKDLRISEESVSRISNLANTIDGWSTLFRGTIAFKDTVESGFEALKDGRIGNDAVLFSASDYRKATHQKTASALKKPHLKKAIKETTEERMARKGIDF